MVHMGSWFCSCHLMSDVRSPEVEDLRLPVANHFTTLLFSIMFSNIYHATHIITNIFKITIFDITTHAPYFQYFFCEWYILPVNPPPPPLFELVWCLCTLHYFPQWLGIDHHEPGYTTCRYGAADLSTYVVILRRYLLGFLMEVTLAL